LETVKSFFDRRASDPSASADPMVLSAYGGAVSERERWWTPEVQDRLFADVRAKLFGGKDPAGLRILELGCAGGNVLRHLVAGPARLVGLDLSLPMLRVARQLVGARARLIQGNGLALPFLDGQFDRVLCYSVITNLPDLVSVERLLEESVRVLAPGGTLLVGNTPLRLDGSPEGRRRSFLPRALGIVRGVLVPPPPSIHNLSFEPAFFSAFGTKHQLQCAILALDIPGYPHARSRFDALLTKPGLAAT
jgi:SAM-dependent methyltransferase